MSVEPVSQWKFTQADRLLEIETVANRVTSEAWCSVSHRLLFRVTPVNLPKMPHYDDNSHRVSDETTATINDLLFHHYNIANHLAYVFSVLRFKLLTDTETQYTFDVRFTQFAIVLTQFGHVIGFKPMKSIMTTNLR